MEHGSKWLYVCHRHSVKAICGSVGCNCVHTRCVSLCLSACCCCYARCDEAEECQVCQGHAAPGRGLHLQGVPAAHPLLPAPRHQGAGRGSTSHPHHIPQRRIHAGMKGCGGQPAALCCQPSVLPLDRRRNKAAAAARRQPLCGQRLVTCACRLLYIPAVAPDCSANIVRMMLVCVWLPPACARLCRRAWRGGCVRQSRSSACPSLCVVSWQACSRPGTCRSGWWTPSTLQVRPLVASRQSVSQSLAAQRPPGVYAEGLLESREVPGMPPYHSSPTFSDQRWQYNGNSKCSSFVVCCWCCRHLPGGCGQAEASARLLSQGATHPPRAC